MRRGLALFFLGCAVVFAADPVNVHEQVKRLGRGVNILGYDPFWDPQGKARFQEGHFKLIHEGGFQTVRVNLHALSRMDDSNRLNEDWWKKLDWVVSNATAAGLNVILDLHNFTDVAEKPEYYRPKIMSFWKQVSAHYKDAPSSVVFEILNEPNGKLTHELWNQYLAEALAIIRETNPQRTVVVGPAMWNGIPALNTLELPENDRNLIVTVHYYNPMRFTHQGAPWSPATVKLSGITWGTEDDKRKVVEDLGRAQEWAKERNRPILLGEFGAYDKGDMESRARYTDHVARTAESFGWAWAYWQFDSNFIVYDIDKSEWVEPIWKALIP